MNVQSYLNSPEWDSRRISPSSSWQPARLRAPLPRERVITLASLSNRIPDGFIAEAFSQALYEITGKSALLIHLELAESPFTLRDWSELYPMINGEFGLANRLRRVHEQLSEVRIGVASELSDPQAIKHLMEHCSRHFDQIIFHLDPQDPVSLMTQCMLVSDRAFLLLQPTSDNLYHRDLLHRELRADPRCESFNLKTIVCREDGEEHFNEVLKTLASPIHGFIHGCPSPSAALEVRSWKNREFNADIRRMAREVTHTRVGLALSSGGARSLAHIGVIQVLEENGIEVDVIAGCSMGAYIGSVWAYGYDGETMERLAREVEKRWGVLELIDPFILPRQGFLRGEKVKRRLKRSIGDVHFSELVRPLRIVATNLTTLEAHIFSTGEVATAVHASSAIPGACAPVKVGEELYVDGGISDPLPVDVLQEMGIEKIIAVNTIPTPAYLRCRMEMEREQAELRGNKPGKIRSFVHQYLNYFAPGNILDIILRAFHGAQMRVAEHSCLQADLVLRPLSFDGRWHDFRHPGKYIALGRLEAEEHLAEIQAL
ncbi:MAG TPA: patatin-like phospholipase family protein, partial [Candidatus Saccharimonadales bacterium]|nr:patatin-like phospholipase family protein [Candidatus Saccharimonadales bacterium]